MSIFHRHGAFNDKTDDVWHSDPMSLVDRPCSGCEGYKSTRCSSSRVSITQSTSIATYHSTHKTKPSNYLLLITNYSRCKSLLPSLPPWPVSRRLLRRMTANWSPKVLVRKPAWQFLTSSSATMSSLSSTTKSVPWAKIVSCNPIIDFGDISRTSRASKMSC